MMDETQKTVLIDESLPVQQLVTMVCDKIGISNPEEYSFMPETIPTGSISSKEKRGSKGNLADTSDESMFLFFSK